MSSTELCELPEGWRLVRLREIAAEIRYGYTQSASEKQIGPKFVRITDITSGTIDWERVPYCDCDNQILDKYRISPGDILIARSGSVGASILVRDVPEAAVFASYLIRVRLDGCVVPEYVGLALKSPFCQSQLVPRGATQKNINAKKIGGILLPLPPLTEQRRIVARVEALLERVREARRLRQQARQDTERLWQAVLAEAFPTKSSELPEEWKWVRLAEVCEETERRDPRRTPETEFVYVEISSIDNENGVIQSPKQIAGHQAPSRARKVIRANDVLFATTRPYLKNIALVPDELDNQICSTGFCVLRANKHLVLPEFLYYIARSEIIVKQLVISSMRGASYPAVTDEDVLGVKIPLPPLPQQKKIVSYLKRAQDQVQSLRAVQDETERELFQLEQAILEKAFRGEL